MYLQGREQTVADEREGVQSRECIEPYRNAIRAVLALPGGRRWWGERKTWSSASFQREVEKLMTEAARVDPNEVLSPHIGWGA